MPAVGYGIDNDITYGWFTKWPCRMLGKQLSCPGRACNREVGGTLDGAPTVEQ